ncbi:CNNM family magnesium/cobalt transport protein CorC [Buchnera aphidicola (Mindarus keteleerifoliae)]|uniref:CNNM family magnesium/cobalt transport protein CorC n=1 Tax=Buchnera aphidicola TaxID=9 RepID=UPI0031B6E83C
MNDSFLKNINKDNKKGFFSILLHQIFNDEPKNREELLKLIQESKEKELIDQTTKNMLEGAILITKKTVKEIMIPRTQMITLNLNYNLNKCLEIIIKSAHSRFPVMSKDKNYIEGFLIAKDLLSFIYKEKKLFFIKKFLRPPIVVPESKHLDKMLKEFQLKRNHMAIVIDEFGIVSGLITIEDILELIVGKIEDEFDNVKEMNIRQINQFTFLIKGLTQIKEFNEKFNTNFFDKEVDTIGGLIIKKVGYVPKINKIICIDNYQFKISTIDNRKILTIHVKIPKNLLLPSLKK